MNINFKQKFNTPTEQLIRRCGYGLVRDRRARQASFSRRLGSGVYPRFHMYVNSQDPLILSLHIDQKQVSYEGQKAHSGDYDSEKVKQEADRIYQLIMSQGGMHEEEEEEQEENQGFFAKLFGK